MNFKKRVNGSWTDTSNYIHNTATDTITSLPVVLYPTGTTATVGLKGNTVQNGTPTPAAPVIPEGCGDLETSGDKAGQYKIPISSANTTTPVYLGEVETTRKVKKLVLTGEEANWYYYENSTDTVKFFYLVIVRTVGINLNNLLNSHGFNATEVTQQSGNTVIRIYAVSESVETIEEWKSYLAAQYAADTPVTVWYVLAEPETAVVNEPLMKIGEYADEVSNISIPVTTGGNTLSVVTTVQPSEITANYSGWHTIATHERESGQWN